MRSHDRLRPVGIFAELLLGALLEPGDLSDHYDAA